MAQGDARAARQELAAAWVYLGSSLYDEAWRSAGPERDRQRQRWEAADAGVRALEAGPRVAALEKTAVDALTAARGSRRPRAAMFESAAVLADECVAAVPAGARGDLTAPGMTRSLVDLDASCQELAKRAREEAGEAARRAQARDAELRGVLRGERLEIYQRFGDPEPGMEAARDVARAPIWRFVIGPSGPLRRYETWTFEFKGDRVVAKRRTETRE